MRAIHFVLVGFEKIHQVHGRKINYLRLHSQLGLRANNCELRYLHEFDNGATPANGFERSIHGLRLFFQSNHALHIPLPVAVVVAQPGSHEEPRPAHENPPAAGIPRRGNVQNYRRLTQSSLLDTNQEKVEDAYTSFGGLPAFAQRVVQVLDEEDFGIKRFA